MVELESEVRGMGSITGMGRWTRRAGMSLSGRVAVSLQVGRYRLWPESGLIIKPDSSTASKSEP